VYFEKSISSEIFLEEEQEVVENLISSELTTSIFNKTNY